MTSWTPTDEIDDSEYAICPACGRQHGDCWEWLTDDMNPVEHECGGCGAKLVSGVSYSTTYTTRVSQ